MANNTIATPSSSVRQTQGTALQRFLQATEIDTRLLGMIAALLCIWLGFQYFTGGLFLTPRNLWNLTVQAASVSVMATGMVLVIVTRNIDLSVGSILGFVGMIMAITQAKILPPLIGFDNPATWIIALTVGIVLGTAIGAFQGVIIAFLNVPAFIVTLGGLLIWRAAAFLVISAALLLPRWISTFRLMGGGAEGSIGATASWVVGIIACLIIVASIINSRKQRKRFGFPLRPMWAEYFLSLVGCVTVMIAVWVLNSYYMPVNLAKKYAEANNIPWPEGGLQIPLGIAIPVLMAVASPSP
jgi:D-xylose transport system permease protein